MSNKINNDQIIKNVNKYGKNKYICVNPEVEYKHNNRYVLIQHLLTKEIKKVSYQNLKKSNPFGKKFNKLEVLNSINKFGKKNKNKYICINPDFGYKGTHRIVKIKNTKTGEIKCCRYNDLINGSDPFYIGKSRNKIIEIKINKIGKKAVPKFICVNPEIGYLGKGDKRLVKIQCLETKTEKILRLDSLNKNSFKQKGEILRLNDNLIKKTVNNLGKKQDNSYVYLSHHRIKIKKRSLLKVTIQSLENRKIATTRFCSLKVSNPFNQIHNKLEIEKIQPMYEKLLKKYKVNYIKEFNLGKKRIDFMFVINGKRYGLEVKQSDKKHYSGRNQVQNYKKLANLRQYNLDKVLLSDPKGKHLNSLSILQFEKFIKTLKSVLF